MIQNKYTREELFNSGIQRVYRGKYLNEVSFPLGGIGTGSIGLSGRGSLKDFEIFNRPNIGSWFPKTFALLRVKQGEQDPICRVLEGPIQKPYTPKDGGAFHGNAEGFPHMDRCELRGEYPFAWMDFFCDKMPVKVQLEAYNPFIPSDPDESSYPVAILRYYVTNNSQMSIQASILWSLLNIVGLDGDETLKILVDKPFEPNGDFYNEFKESANVRAIVFRNKAFKEDHPKFGSIALATPDKQITYAKNWEQDVWFSPHYHVWNTFKETGKSIEAKKNPNKKMEAGTITISKEILPGKTESFIFYITWHFPNFVKYWHPFKRDESLEGKPTWKNYYASLFKDAFDVADKLSQKEPRLCEQTKSFHDALYSCTIPPYVIDAIASNLSTLKTVTCLRLTDGTFYGWEGCSTTQGCCEGTCTHVWNYQQALPFLFPRLERSVHDANYEYNFVRNTGALKFRTQLPLGSKGGWSHPCADGQLGEVIHIFREWKISGDDTWLKNTWPQAKRALEYAFELWDKDKRGYLDDWQHNTYDVDFYGPNPMLTCYYLGALKAGSEIARFTGDLDSAKEYLELLEKGRKWIDDNLFNGEYYVQKFDPNIAKINQFGTGCLIDQLVGQQLTRIVGLGNFLELENIKSTLISIFKYNWKANMQDHENGGRLYAVNEEAATVVCTWPKGDRQKVSFPYADEVMNGFEYQFGVHCMLEGLLEEGFTVFKSIRDRYDGYGRNPWNEIECGNHYARSMASYGALIALSGFEFDKGQGYLKFSPLINKNEFKCFWSLDAVWGTYSQTKESCCIEVLYGSILIQKLKLPHFSNMKKISLSSPERKDSIDFDSEGFVMFREKVKLDKFQQLKIRKE